MELSVFHGLHGLPWHPWISIDPHGLYGHPWIPLISWISMESIEIHWFHVFHGIHRNQWIPFISYISMDHCFHGRHVLPLTPCGIHGIHGLPWNQWKSTYSMDSMDLVDLPATTSRVGYPMIPIAGGRAWSARPFNLLWGLESLQRPGPQAVPVEKEWQIEK